ncbi:MAG: YebC/PmpR family DNA-binding transcriptional regulator [Elusimicrobia bacterium]|nr:YebC/PmpR family DNA-binding transcriptional regulator [Elusimicrobiota bacterium]
MGGHSHWAGIKHKKAAMDAKKGKVYTRLIREIAIAARGSGGNPETNPRLRKAMEDARAANMPSDNVERAILRGLGKLPGAVIEEVKFEGYGPSGVAVMVEATTDNKNRTTSEIRKIFTSSGGSLGELGSVSWVFQNKGYIEIEKSKVSEDKLYEIAVENGAEDVKSDEKDIYKVIVPAQDFDRTKKALEAGGISLLSAEVTYLPTTEVKVEGDTAEKVIALMEALEEHDDVKNVFANYNVPDEILAKHE